jgi:hypothetical protein
VISAAGHFCGRHGSLLARRAGSTTGLILIQPSELAKIIMIMVLAAYFASTKMRRAIWRGWQELCPDLWGGGLDPAAAEPEHVAGDHDHVVCDDVDQRAANKVPADVCLLAVVLLC